MTTSLAAVYDGTPNTIEVRRLEIPEPGPGEILVRNLGCTVCGSDIHTFSGRRTTPVPTILGHEMVGEILTLGEDAPTHDLAGAPLRPGDRVTWAIVASCGGCSLCVKGLPQKCKHAVKYGHIAFSPGRELFGGYAEHCLLARGSALMRIPDDMPLSVACPANCATGTAAAAIAAATEELGSLAGQAVCVLGLGLVGLTAGAMAHSAGAAAVVCVDPSAARRAVAPRFGVDACITPDALAETARETNGGDGFDTVIECAGPSANFLAALSAVRLGGTVVLVGSTYPDAPVAVQVDQIVRRNIRIRGIHNYTPADLRTAVGFLAQHHQRMPFAEVVGPWVPLREIHRALDTAAKAQTLRVGVTMRD
ncbi:MAG: zinc-binding dehydrogenase [Phycisphaerales bacterium]|nr:zinc-binding dehydrogenase [Phycisphaerales bacterium]